MSGGLLALLDDVVALTKVAAVTLDDAAGQAAKVSAKAAGVVIDDAAVTPRYVTGLSAERELPIVWRIAKGSITNKLLFLLPAALLLSYFLPQAITPILMLGGIYLAFEGFEKVHHMLTGPPKAVQGLKLVANLQKGQAALEEERVRGAIRTDFILSAEIMAIALAAITAPDLFTKALVLATVAILITVGVYGVVAVIVKADDIGARLVERNGAISGPIGRALVRGMPPFLELLSIIGMLAMLWVGGGIIVHGLAEFGYPQVEHFIHHAADAVSAALAFGNGVIHWLVTAIGSGIVGLAVGGVMMLLVGLGRAVTGKGAPAH
ncbi:DUF808 domain-containing protein [Hyphomicrobium sp. D-2]|uniref:DUF808 domain-containing protein n=1 Tax=Hyphomicrobium sp. D-2 TaxID=3041621 RepID=UPI002453E59D|nr:DUF808 domain-containing protein [Hyphomicrobium sp. D-2]MDH4982197.1 DUF808 domain-containing protein [Hyphomicrobium sp. D-2]